MTKPVITICNQCNKITDTVFKERLHPNKVRETYFKCEHCFYHYTSFVTDSWVRKKQRHKDSIKGIHNAQVRLDTQDKINKRMSKLKYNLVNFGRADL